MIFPDKIMRLDRCFISVNEQLAGDYARRDNEGGTRVAYLTRGRTEIEIFKRVLAIWRRKE